MSAVLDQNRGMKFRIPRCYDSHVHFLPTGEYLSISNVRSCTRLNEAAAILKSAGRESYRGDLLVGFGWGDELAAEVRRSFDDKPRSFLDSLELDVPIAISRRDGHASWVNTKLLEKLGWVTRTSVPEDLRDFVPADENGNSTGLLLERAHFKQLEIFPPVSETDRENYLLKAQELFLKQGFTHVREMMADAELFQDLVRLDQQKKLKLYFELNYSVQRFSELTQTLDLIESHRKDTPKRIRPLGLKVFMDGALGSEGAFLSFPYEGKHEKGQLLWTADDTRQMMKECWQRGFSIACHCIGDASLDLVLTTAQSLKADGIEGPLALEHAEMVHPDSFKKMRGLNLEFHFQPSHYLGDSEWLREKLGERFSWCFPWAKIEKIGFPIYFGSDSPIVEPSLQLTVEGLKKSAEAGIPACLLDWKFAHSHPDSRWGKEMITDVNEFGEVLKLHGV